MKTYLLHALILLILLFYKLYVSNMERNELLEMDEPTKIFIVQGVKHERSTYFITMTGATSKQMLILSRNDPYDVKAGDVVAVEWNFFKQYFSVHKSGK